MSVSTWVLVNRNRNAFMFCLLVSYPVTLINSFSICECLSWTLLCQVPFVNHGINILWDRVKFPSEGSKSRRFGSSMTVHQVSSFNKTQLAMCSICAKHCGPCRDVKEIFSLRNPQSRETEKGRDREYRPFILFIVRRKYNRSLKQRPEKRRC